MTKSPKILKVTTELNYNYTVTCTDGKGNKLLFRDITGSDIEYLDSLLGGEGKNLTSGQVIKLLSTLSVDSTVNFGSLVPRAIRSLYAELSKHVLCNYMDKETWLKQCYSIQNGSFQNLSAMESVPMSKFAAMCLIHKEAMDNVNTNPVPSGYDSSTPAIQ